MMTDTAPRWGPSVPRLYTQDLYQKVCGAA